MAATFYRLDGGTQTAGTMIDVSSVGTHSIEFWSVDVAGNAETGKAADFAVTPPPPPPVTSASSVSIRSSSYTGRRGGIVWLSGRLAPSGVRDAVTVYVQRPGSTVWSRLCMRGVSRGGSWLVRYPLGLSGIHSFKVQFRGDALRAPGSSRVISVRALQVLSDD